MGKPKNIELVNGLVIPILYEDRSVMGIDKPAGWLLAPDSWEHTGRNLQLALNSSIQARDFWAQSRNLRFLRFVHRLDADTSGVLLLAKSLGAVTVYTGLFETRSVEKVYLAAVQGVPKEKQWTCRAMLAPQPGSIGRMIVDNRNGKDAETHFRVLATRENSALVEAHPTTGRTHQIRVHLAESGYPVVNDPLYGPHAAKPSKGFVRLALRAVKLSYPDPFLKRLVYITAPTEEFIREFGFRPADFPARPVKPAIQRETKNPKPEDPGK